MSISLPCVPRALGIAACAMLVGAPVMAQGSTYIPLDDPSLPLLEHLIQRGSVEDPSPMVRPFTQADADRVLSRADTAPDSPVGELISMLRQRYGPPADERWAAAEARGGFQAYSTPRRDLLHPVGDGGIDPYATAAVRGGFGNIVAATRVGLEPRMTNDPDWPGRRSLEVAGRLMEGYLAAQFKYAQVAYGQLDHNWGPEGLPGIPLSNYGYERQGLALHIGNRAVRLSALATDLHDGPDSAGQIVHRYYFVHRLAVRLSDRVDIAAWEGNILAGDRNFETRYRNPLSVGYLANTIGLGDRGNEMLGLDLRWRAIGRTTIETQLALDDFWYQHRDRNRDRWAMTVAASGAGPGPASWRIMYSQVSSLALRAFNRAENFTDAGVGIGRNFSDNDQLTLRLSLPLRRSWLVSPRLTLFRQGEGRIEDPYPSPEDRRTYPALFVGTMERTYGAGVAVRGSEGPLELVADVGIQHVTSLGHVPGVSKTRLAARVQATVGLDWVGAIGE